MHNQKLCFELSRKCELLYKIMRNKALKSIFWGKWFRSMLVQMPVKCTILWGFNVSALAQEYISILRFDTYCWLVQYAANDFPLQLSLVLISLHNSNIAFNAIDSSFKTSLWFTYIFLNSLHVDSVDPSLSTYNNDLTDRQLSFFLKIWLQKTWLVDSPYCSNRMNMGLDNKTCSF